MLYNIIAVSITVSAAIALPVSKSVQGEVRTVHGANEVHGPCRKSAFLVTSWTSTVEDSD